MIRVNSVISIGDNAFCGCERLQSITIPNSVTYIGVRAFKGCERLKSITIPNSVTYIGVHTFKGCERLKSITIPNSVTYIYSCAFDECTGLESITISNSVTSIRSDAFKGCNNAKFIVASEAMKNYISSKHGIDGGRITVDAALYTPENAWKWPEDGHLKIPENIKVISDRMFYNRSDIKTVTISNSVTEIDYRAFEGCTELTSIAIPNSVESINYGAFDGCDNAKLIVASEAMKNYISSRHDIDGYDIDDYMILSRYNMITVDAALYTPENAWKWPEDGHIQIPENIAISDCRFDWRDDIKTVTIPNSVTSIGKYAFGGCDNLEKIFVRCPDGTISGEKAKRIKDMIEHAYPNSDKRE